MAHGEDLQPGAVQELLDQIVARTVAGTGAHAGAFFLLEPGGEVLVLDASLGMPTGFVGLLRRLRVAAIADGPLAEAVLQRRLVWVGSGEEFARRYPQLALAFPFVGARWTTSPTHFSPTPSHQETVPTTPPSSC